MKMYHLKDLNNDLYYGYKAKLTEREVRDVMLETLWFENIDDLPYEDILNNTNGMTNNEIAKITQYEIEEVI
jgi:hypothetical protein